MDAASVAGGDGRLPHQPGEGGQVHRAPQTDPPRLQRCPERQIAQHRMPHHGGRQALVPVTALETNIEHLLVPYWDALVFPPTSASKTPRAKIFTSN